MNFWQKLTEVVRLVKVGDFTSYLQAAKIINDLVSEFLATVAPNSGPVMMGAQQMVTATMTVDECCSQLEAVANNPSVSGSADPKSFPWTVVLPLVLQLLQKLLTK